jgi:hypothetical protein
MPNNPDPAPAQPNQITYRQPIPGFSGEADVVDWLRSFERWATQAGLGDEQKLRAVEAAMSGKALNWFGYMDRDGKLDEWSTFETEVRERFRQKTSSQDLCKALTGLTQQSSESVKDFTDRVNKVGLMFKEECALPNSNTPEGDRLKKAARDAMLTLIKKTLFITGLRDDIRHDLLKQHVETWEEAQTAAERIEKAEKPKGKQGPGKVIHSMEEKDEQGANSSESFASMSEQRGRGNGRGRGSRGRGGRGAGAGNNANGRPSWLRDQLLPPGTCYRCGHQGHIRSDCVTKPENFYWATLAQTMAQQRNVAALGNTMPQWPMLQQPPTQAPWAPQPHPMVGGPGQWPLVPAGSSSQPQQEQASSASADRAPLGAMFPDF